MMELEVDIKVPFLNNPVQRSADRFSIYRKHKQRCPYTHTHTSYHPLYVERDVTTSLILCALRIYDTQYLDGEIDFLRRLFSTLGYPRHVLGVALSRAQHTFYHNLH